tara:strand:+ start:1700 stop:2002 length:303 start_codon:yes stop_codon:yes gene_type:complete
MKNLKYKNEINIKISKKMALAFHSEKVLHEIMLGKDAPYKNYNEFVLFLIDSYCKNRREWFQVPEVKEYIFAQAGGHEPNTTRHYRDKIKKYIKHIISKL